MRAVSNNLLLVLRTALLGASLVGITVGALASTKSDTVVTVQALAPSPEQMHQELRALKATMEKALNEMDIDTVVDHVADDIVFTTMNGDLVRGRADVRKYFETMMRGDTRRVQSVQTKFDVGDAAKLYGNDVAVAFGTSKDHYVLAGGEDFDVQARWSSTMIRRDGKWLVANFHYSTNMFDNPVLDAQRKFGIKVALAILAALTLLAFWLGRVQGKKSASR